MTRFEQLKYNYENNYITIQTLRGWVNLNERKPGKGITAEEFTIITGQQY